MFLYLIAIHKDLSRRRLDNRRDTSKCRRLPCPVRPQKSVDLSCSCRQRQVIYRSLLRILGVRFLHLLFVQLINFGEITDLDLNTLIHSLFLHMPKIVMIFLKFYI